MHTLMVGLVTMFPNFQIPSAIIHGQMLSVTINPRGAVLLGRDYGHDNALGALQIAFQLHPGHHV